MKGWVYIISNPSMPGLVKVGYSTKDPELRARELDNTGSPHSYIVEYEMLIEHPFQIEQKAHKELGKCREKKEWFRCSCEEAIVAIQRVAKGQIITESFKRADREDAERRREDQEKTESRRKLINSRIGLQEIDVGAKYDEMLSLRFPTFPLWQYCIACSIVGLLIVGVFFIFIEISLFAVIMLSGQSCPKQLWTLGHPTV